LEKSDCEEQGNGLLCALMAGGERECEVSVYCAAVSQACTMSASWAH